jgi:hypothetical protein
MHVATANLWMMARRALALLAAFARIAIALIAPSG